LKSFLQLRAHLMWEKKYLMVQSAAIAS